MHVTVGTRLSQTGGDVTEKMSPAAQLEKTRGKILAKLMAIMSDLRAHSNFTMFEPTFGGRFPKATYDSIIQEVQK